MYQISNLNLYIGTFSEAQTALNQGMRIISCTRNDSKDLFSHKVMVGWRGSSCSKSNPSYLIYQTKDKNITSLNITDANSASYFSDKLIDPVVRHIHDSLQDGKAVYIYCSKCESRSPSLALLYLKALKILKSDNPIEEFKINYYPNYNPNKGIRDYILNKNTCDFQV